MLIVKLIPHLDSLFFAFFWAEGFSLYPRLFNLAIFLIVLGFILRKPFTQAMQDRRDAILSELQRAKAEKSAAEDKLREIEGRLNRLNDEINEIKTNAEREAKLEYERILKQSEEEAARLRLTAQREIEGATKAAQLELKDFAAAKSVELAETIIRKEIKPEDDSRLINDFARELEGVK